MDDHIRPKKVTVGSFDTKPIYLVDCEVTKPKEKPLTVFSTPQKIMWHNAVLNEHLTIAVLIRTVVNQKRKKDKEMRNWRQHHPCCHRKWAINIYK